MHERIKHYLDSNGILYKHVAERANIKRQRFYRLVSGAAPLVVDEYEIICRDGLGLDPGYFFNLNVVETKKASSV